MHNARHTIVLLALSLSLTPAALAQEHATSRAGVASRPVPVSEQPVSTPDQDGVSFKGLLVTLGRDLSRLPSKETALTLGIGGALAFAALPADRNLTRRAVSSELLDSTFEVGDPLGSGFAQVGGAVATFILGRATSSPSLQSLGADLIRAQALNSLMTQGMKVSVGRSRPDGARFSFPSGHSSASFATASVIQRHYGWKLALPAYGAATYIAASRLQENRHYASDVIFGAAVGIVAGRTVTVGRGPARFSVAPMAVPGGVGVTFAAIGTP